MHVSCVSAAASAAGSWGWRGCGRVRLRWVEAEGFLSFGGRVRLELGPGLTVVTGPNAAGKSNLGRCLDVARAAVESVLGDTAARVRLSLYDDAGYEGAGEFVVRLGLDLDQEWERNLTRTPCPQQLAASRR